MGLRTITTLGATGACMMAFCVATGSLVYNQFHTEILSELQSAGMAALMIGSAYSMQKLGKQIQNIANGYASKTMKP